MNGIMMKRRQFLVLSAAVLAGCAGRRSPGWFEYTENVSSILMSEDGDKIVVAGRDHHYVFDAPAVLVDSIRADFHPYATARIESFWVADQEQTVGTLELMLSPDAPDVAVRQAIEAGYEKCTRQDDKPCYSRRLSLRGVRYDASGMDRSLAQQDLQQTYPVPVIVDQIAAPSAAEKLATPVTLAVNGVVTLASIPLAILFAPVGGLVLLMCRDNKGCSFGGGH